MNSLSQLRPVLEELRAAGMEKVMTAFDMDYLINPHVRAGQENLAHLLDQCGISYGTLPVGPPYKGLDDYIWVACAAQSEREEAERFVSSLRYLMEIK